MRVLRMILVLMICLAIGGISGAAYRKGAASKVWFFAKDMATGLPKTGDAANITAYGSKDFGEAFKLTDTTATEPNSTTQKGYYLFDVSAEEMDSNVVNFTALSTTGDVNVAGPVISTLPVDANGLMASSIEDPNSGAMTAADLAEAIWNAAIATYGSAGSYGLSVETLLSGTTAAAITNYIIQHDLKNDANAVPGTVGERILEGAKMKR
jgi:hypothetical protein